MKLRWWHVLGIGLVALVMAVATGCTRMVDVPPDSYDIIEPEPGESYELKTVDGRRYSTTNLTRADSTLVIGGAETRRTRRREKATQTDPVTLELHDVARLRRMEPRLARHGVALALGDRVRAYRDDGTMVVGRVVAIDGDAVEVDGAQALELQSIRGMERWEGTHGHGVAGALIGAPVGLLGGLAWAVNDWELFSGKDPGSAPVVIGIALGAIVGYTLGAIDRSSEWRRVDLRRLDVDVTPTPSGARAGVFWDF